MLLYLVTQHTVFHLIYFLCFRYVRSEPLCSRPTPVRAPVSQPVLSYRDTILKSQDALPCHIHLHTNPCDIGHVSRHVRHHPLPHLPATSIPWFHSEPEWAFPDQQHAVSLLWRFFWLISILHGAGRGPLSDKDAATVHQRINRHQPQPDSSPKV